jgi:hypothetical protein
VLTQRQRCCACATQRATWPPGETQIGAAVAQSALRECKFPYCHGRAQSAPQKIRTSRRKGRRTYTSRLRRVHFAHAGRAHRRDFRLRKGRGAAAVLFSKKDHRSSSPSSLSSPPAFSLSFSTRCEAPSGDEGLSGSSPTLVPRGTSWPPSSPLVPSPRPPSKWLTGKIKSLFQERGGTRGTRGNLIQGENCEKGSNRRGVSTAALTRLA